MTARPSRGNTSFRWFLLISLLAGTFHGVLAWAVFPSEVQLYKYPLAAGQLLAGTLPADRSLDFSPLYLYLHASSVALTRVFGAAGPKPAAQLIQGVQVVAVAASTGLFFLLLRRFFALGLALAATAAFVLNRSVAVYSSVLEPEIVLLLFVLAVLYFSQFHERGYRLIAGIALALALALRPSVLPLLAGLPFYVALTEVKGRRLSATLLMCVPALVVGLGLTWRNGADTGSYSPFGMNPGFVFFEGNNPLSSGKSAVYSPMVAQTAFESGDVPDAPHVAYRQIAEASAGVELPAGATNRFWRARAITFAADHPARFAASLARKAYLALHSYRRHDLVTAERFDRRLSDLRIPAFPLALLAALAPLGLFASRRRWRAQLLILALLYGQGALMVLFYVSDRQRLLLVPCLVFFACAAVAYLQRADRRTRLTAVAACIALAAAFSVDSYHAREDRHVWAAYGERDPLWLRSFQLRDDGRLAEAAQAAALAHAATPWLSDYARPAGLPFEASLAEKALAATPLDDGNPSRQFDRALLFIQVAQFEEAEALLRSLAARGERFDRGFLTSSEPLFYLGRIAARRGNRHAAVELFERALARNPGDPFVLAQLAALTGNPTYAVTVARYYSTADALFLVGAAQLEHGTQDHGVTSLNELVQRMPELWRARILLSAALGAVGNLDGAVREYHEAMAVRSEPAMMEEQIVPIFAAFAERGPADARAQYDYALVLEQFGRFGEALSALRAAKESGGGADVERALERVTQLVERDPRDRNTAGY